VFNLESFLEALAHDSEDTVLLAEAHMALLRLLLSDRRLDSYYYSHEGNGHAKSSSSAVGALIAGRPDAHAVTSLTWPAIVREVVPNLETFHQTVGEEDDDDLLGGNWGLDDVSIIGGRAQYSSRRRITDGLCFLSYCF